MNLKRSILALICLALILSLGIGMVMSGCKSEKTTGKSTTAPAASGTPSTNTAGGDGTTAPSTQEGTETAPSSSEIIYNTLGPDETAPSVDLEITDREELPTQSGTESTTPSGSTGNQGNTGSQGSTGSQSGSTGNQGSTGNTGTTTGPELDENGNWTYEYYISRTGQEQMDYMRTFPTLKDFNTWYNAAKKAYDDAHPKETIGSDGNITLH